MQTLFVAFHLKKLAEKIDILMISTKFKIIYRLNMLITTFPDITI